MIKKIYVSIFFIVLTSLGFAEDNYKTLDEIYNNFVSISDGDLAKIDVAGKSDGGKDIFFLRIGKEKGPAIFIGANISGYYVPATQSAYNLASYIIQKIKSGDKAYNEKTYYIFPVLNPDLYSDYFEKPLAKRVKNYTPIDEDGDGLVDEDPPEDLNKDGYITIMRVKSPDGKFIEDDKFPFKLKKADPVKGERGIYKYYTEGVDNDGDGEFNEDAKGGVIINNNFPAMFKYNDSSAGSYPVSQNTTRVIVDFVVHHNNIMFAYIIDRTNNMLKLPEAGAKGAGEMKVKVPEVMAKALGIDTDKEYTLRELASIAKQAGFGYGMDITEDMVAQHLGITPPGTMDRDDYKYLQELSNSYKELAKEYNVNIKTKALGEEPGSLINWLYFHIGILAIGVDVWSLPEAEKKDDKQDTQDKSLKNYIETELQGKGTVPWQKFDHPDLGEIEIGGVIPYVDEIPPCNKIDKNLTLVNGFFDILVKKSPDIRIEGINVKEGRGGSYRVSFYIVNEGYLPFYINMAKKTKVSPPILVTLGLTEDALLIEGEKLYKEESLGGLGDSRKIEYLIIPGKDKKIEIKVSHGKIVDILKTVELGGTK